MAGKEIWKDEEIVLSSIHNFFPMQVFLTTPHCSPTYFDSDHFDPHPPLQQYTTNKPPNWVMANSTIFPSKLHNLFRLFFLASIFFFSAWAFVNPPSFFSVVVVATVDAAEPPTPVSTAAATTDGWSWPLPLAVTVKGTSMDGDGDGDGSGKAAPGPMIFWSALSADVLDWSTFSAVVDSEIAPVLNLGFGLAWIPV